MSLEMIIAVASGLVAGVVVGLKVIAPMTANKVDDAVLARLEAIEAVLKGLKG